MCAEGLSFVFWLHHVWHLRFTLGASSASKLCAVAFRLPYDAPTANGKHSKCFRLRHDVRWSKKPFVVTMDTPLVASWDSSSECSFTGGMKGPKCSTPLWREAHRASSNNSEVQAVHRVFNCCEQPENFVL